MTPCCWVCREGRDLGLLFTVMTGDGVSASSDCSDALSPCSDSSSVAVGLALVAFVTLVLEGAAAVLGVIGAASAGANGSRFGMEDMVAPGRLGIKRAVAGGGESLDEEEGRFAATKPKPAAATVPTATVATSLCCQSAEAAASTNRPNLAQRSNT